MKITITTYRGQQVEVEAEKTASPYLVIHPTAKSNGEKIVLAKSWSITHLPTLYGVLQDVRYKKWALEACKVFAKAKGWENLTPEPNRQTAFRLQNQQILEEGRRIAYQGKK